MLDLVTLYDELIDGLAPVEVTADAADEDVNSELLPLASTTNIGHENSHVGHHRRAESHVRYVFYVASLFGMDT